MKNLLFAALFIVVGFSARAQEVTNTNHTVVRFEVSTGGALFGTIDIELFDQEKPETVKNFLRYVYRGVYSNLVLHRLVTNFVLQAGHITVPNPASGDAFSDYVQARNFGEITNEYSVGPELSNLYGTIAMARVPGQTNSASADWFINLTNNPSLDAVDGGFTVFGRVVNTSGGNSGTNLLNYFNAALTRSVFIPRTFEFFSEVPVSGTPLPAPRYADLFTMRAAIIQGPHLPAPNHSVVRFNINTAGTNFGTLDIELFDQEKPETVKNFLLYVHSSVYSNLAIHRLVPGAVLQAGRVRIEGQAPGSQFTRYTPGVNWGDITNEFSVGPELSNDYATIAMARIPGVTNSASAEFFVNLTNNPSLNTNDGGFTVFGRVINSFDPRSGTNLLNYFNTFGPGSGIGSAFIAETFEFLFELPVSTDRSTPLISDLFMTQASVLQGAPRDTVKPTTSVLDPVPNAPPNLPAYRTTNDTFHFAGTAGDNQELARVLVDGPAGRFIANGKSDWTREVPLLPGTNRIVAWGLDYFGNLAEPQERTIFYSLPRPVSLQITGRGKVVGITNGQILEVGVTYPITARPGAGQYFNGWRGSLASDDRTAYFTMVEDGEIIVRFSKTLLGLAPGRYEGVFFPGTNGMRNSSGFISLNLRPNGLYSGRLQPFGANYLIRGQLNFEGQSLISGSLGTNTLVLALVLGPEGSEKLGGYYSDGRFVSSFDLVRRQTYVRTNLSPYAGQYTFALSPTSTNGVIEGTGFGSVTVDTRGRIKWSGVLADNAPVAQKAAVLKDGIWPFHFTKRNGDSLAGLATFRTNGTFDTQARWFAPGFLGGTSQVVRLSGSRYTPPSQARLFDWTNGIITLSGDGLPEPISSEVELHEDGSFTVFSNTNNIELTVTTGNGWIGGSFTHPVSNVTTPLKGVALQSSNSAAGFFPVGTNHGGFRIGRAP